MPDDQPPSPGPAAATGEGATIPPDVEALALRFENYAHQIRAHFAGGSTLPGHYLLAWCHGDLKKTSRELMNAYKRMEAADV